MKLKATLIGLALAAVGACGGGEAAQIEALIKEIASLQAQTLEEMEQNVSREIEAAKVRPLEVNDDSPEELRDMNLRSAAAFRDARVELLEGSLPRDLERARRRKAGRLAGWRDAQAEDAWETRYVPRGFGITPVEFLQEMKRDEESALKAQRERGRDLAARLLEYQAAGDQVATP